MRTRPVSAIMVKVTVRMNVVSSSVLKPSKMRTFTVKVASATVLPHSRVTALHVAAQPCAVPKLPHGR
jgi:hypothetical protein